MNFNERLKQLIANKNIMIINIFQLMQALSASIAQSSVQTIMINDILDLKSIGLVAGVKGIGQLAGSLVYFPLIDIIPITTALKVLVFINVLSCAYLIYSYEEASQFHIYFSHAMTGVTTSAFYPMVSTILAKSTNSDNRKYIFINFSSLSMFAQSLGPLVVALIFKFVNDEWDILLCKGVVQGGLILMTCSLFMLLLISEKHYNEDNQIEDKKLQSKMGGGMFNRVLLGMLSHKIIGTVGMMGIRYQAIFWKDLMHMTPFWTQMISFITTISASILSMHLTPWVCELLGESAAIGVLDSCSAALQLLFLLLQSQNLFSVELVWVIVVSTVFSLSKAIGICDFGVQKTVTMDQTPECHRGKWNMVDSIIGGSSNLIVMAGGFMVEQTGVIGLFQIVSAIKIINLMPNLYIQLVTRDDQDLKIEERKMKLKLEQGLLEKDKEKTRDIKQDSSQYTSTHGSYNHAINPDKNNNNNIDKVNIDEPAINHKN